MDPRLPVSARGLVRRYRALTALDGIDIDLAPGRVTALLGPNGAGKSTFADLVLGRARPDAGELAVLGERPGSRAARLRTGAMLQSAALAPQLTVGEHVELHAGYYPRPRDAAEVLAVTGLADLAGRRYGTLSGGQKRRVQFALAILPNPALLVLDEPTVALDHESRAALWRLVRESADRGATVLLTTHHLDEAEALADEVALLVAGRLVARGTPGTIRDRVGARRVRASTALADVEVRALPGVVGVARAGRHTIAHSTAAEATLRAWLAADPRLADLEVGGASLEDAVLDLTRREAA